MYTGDVVAMELCRSRVAVMDGAEARPRGPSPRPRCKKVGTERGHQRADRWKPESQTTSQSDHMDQSLV